MYRKVLEQSGEFRKSFYCDESVKSRLKTTHTDWDAMLRSSAPHKICKGHPSGLKSQNNCIAVGAEKKSKVQSNDDLEHCDTNTT